MGNKTDSNPSADMQADETAQDAGAVNGDDLQDAADNAAAMSLARKNRHQNR